MSAETVVNGKRSVPASSRSSSGTGRTRSDSRSRTGTTTSARATTPAATSRVLRPGRNGTQTYACPIVAVLRRFGCTLA
jgi:hypothetical protein